MDERFYKAKIQPRFISQMTKKIAACEPSPTPQAAIF
jgi:hypothetical protein